MSQQELLNRVVAVLDRLGIDYMLTGSLASSLHGQPRSTHDIDLVVVLAPGVVKDLVAAFPAPDYYLAEQAISEAIREHSTFNLLSLNEGDKVDFWMLTPEPFDQARFPRKRVEDMQGRKIKVTSPEDTILAKLRWAKESGGSEKQFGDALGVYELQRAKLDHAYLEHWAPQLGIEKLWGDLKAAAKPIE